MAALPSPAAEIDALWNFEDPAQSERAFRTMVERVGADSEAGAELLTQVARSQGLQQKFEDAHRTLDRVENLLRSHATRLRARYLLERGRLLNSSDDPGAAFPLFAHALGVALAAGEDFYAVDAAHMVAIASSGDEQIAWNRRALAMAEGSPDPRARRWRGSLYNNLGWTHHARGEFDDALHCFDQALRAREEQGDTTLIRIARWCVARGLRSLGRVEEALAIQRALLAEHEGARTMDRAVYEELIACLTALGRSDEAQEYEARLVTTAGR
jgi:tetratricopeptide (TPR) repeat protein